MTTTTTGVNLGAVRLRLGRARARLRDDLRTTRRQALVLAHDQIDSSTGARG